MPGLQLGDDLPTDTTDDVPQSKNAALAPEGVDPRTTDWKLHVKPGRSRAPFLRYIRINLPRLTRGLLVLVIAFLAFSAGYVAYQTSIANTFEEPFSQSHLVLWAIVCLAGLFVLLGTVTTWRIWDYGMVPASAAVLTYMGGLMGTAPFVWNGADLYLAAAWNTMLFAAVTYVVLRWALDYGMIAAYPDDQGFED